MAFAKKTFEQFPYDVAVDICARNGSTCHVCRELIEKANVRFCLMLQCHKGCKMKCFVHEECVWKHPESSKVDAVSEIFGLDKLSDEQQTAIKSAFATFKAAAEETAEAREETTETNGETIETKEEIITVKQEQEEVKEKEKPSKKQKVV